MNELMGEEGGSRERSRRKLTFSELSLHPELVSRMMAEGLPKWEITEAFTDIRTFTSLENGMAKEGTLRTARCVKKGLNFYGWCICDERDTELVKTVLKLIKWAGTMRSRGFGKVKIWGETAEG